MNTHSRSLRLFLTLIALLFSFAPAHGVAATEKYHVNVILQRGDVADDVWNDAWKQFRDVFLPTITSGFGSGGGKFKLDVSDERAVFILTNQTTNDFDQTSRDFKSIPDMLPPIDEFSVIIDGPYRGSGTGVFNKKIVRKIKAVQTSCRKILKSIGGLIPIVGSPAMTAVAFDKPYENTKKLLVELKETKANPIQLKTTENALVCIKRARAADSLITQQFYVRKCARLLDKL